MSSPRGTAWMERYSTLPHRAANSHPGNSGGFPDSFLKNHVFCDHEAEIKIEDGVKYQASRKNDRGLNPFYFQSEIFSSDVKFFKRKNSRSLTAGCGVCQSSERAELQLTGYPSN